MKKEPVDKTPTVNEEELAANNEELSANQLSETPTATSHEATGTVTSKNVIKSRH